MEAGTDAAGNNLFQASQNFNMKRAVTPAFWIATIILLLVYVIISFEWMHRTLAALLGAALILFITYTLGAFDKSYFILSFEDAMGAIDLNVIFLLLGMMIFVGVLKKTGMFQFLAYKAYAWSRGNVFVLSFVLQFLTAVISAFLDNVTTMLLVIPVTIQIAVTLKVHPLAFLIPQTFASNVGGTATIIGDPPNILIGSFTGLTFGQFVTNLTLICFLCQIVSCFYFLWWHKKDYLKADVKDVERTIAYLKEEYRITDKKLMIQGLVLLGFTILLFVFHGVLHMEVSVAALIGSLLLLAISKVDIVEMLEKEVEWPSLMFFVGLFIVIAGAEATGLIQQIANTVLSVSQGNLTVAIIMILWVGHCFGLHRQHPLHRHHAPRRALHERKLRSAQRQRPVVGPVPGGLPGRQRHHDRRQRQCGHHGHGRKGRLPHLLCGVHEDLLVAHDHHRQHVYGLLVNCLLMNPAADYEPQQSRENRSRTGRETGKQRNQSPVLLVTTKITI